MKTYSVLWALTLQSAHEHTQCLIGSFEILCILLWLQTAPLCCHTDLFSYTPSLPLSDTLERQTQSPSVYGTTRRSTKSRAQVSWAVSASYPTPSTDSKTLAVSTCFFFVCVCVCITAYSVSHSLKMGHWCLVSSCSLCRLTMAFILRCQSGLLVKGDGEGTQEIQNE